MMDGKLIQPGSNVLQMPNKDDMLVDPKRANFPRYAAIEIDYEKIDAMKASALAKSLVYIAANLPTFENRDMATLAIQLVPDEDGTGIKGQLQLRIFSALTDEAIGQALHKLVKQEWGL